MQKKLIALAIAGLSSAAAFAQSNVSVYGIIDQSYEYGNYGDGNKGFLSGSGYATQRIGFQGEEALGGGLKAIFRLEASLNADKGQGGSVGLNQVTAGATTAYSKFFDRESIIGLSGNWGTAKFGYQYSPAFNTAAAMDVFGVAGVGSNYHQQLTTTRVNNSIRYESPNFSGFTFAGLIGLGDNGVATTGATANNESAGGQTAVGVNKDSGQHRALNVAYSNGPIAAGYGYSTNNNVVLVGTNVVKTKSNLLFGSYDLKVAKLTLGWSKYDNDTAGGTTVDRRVWTFGVSAPVGTGTVRAQYSSRDDKLVTDSDVKHIAIGYVHPLSKRTTAYATWAKTTNKDAGAAGTASAGATFAVSASAIVGSGANAANTNTDPSSFQIGVNHTF